MQCKSILIIEDNADIRDTFEDILKTEGYQVFSVSNGKEGLAALKRIPGPTLILLDMMMPVMNGWEFMEIHNPDETFESPVVVISALGASSALVNREKLLPAVGYIKKPVALNTLMEIVQEYCGPGGQLPSIGSSISAPVAEIGAISS